MYVRENCTATAKRGGVGALPISVVREVSLNLVEQWIIPYGLSQLACSGS
jgi:hypothetical protein